MTRRDDGREPGPLAEEKRGPTSDSGHPQPDTTETQSARLLENQARDRLEGRGLQADEIRRLADEYIALDLGEDVDEFVDWATERGGRDRGTG